MIREGKRRKEHNEKSIISIKDVPFSKVTSIDALVEMGRLLK